MDLSPENYTLIVDQTGHFIEENNNYLLQRKKDKTLMYFEKELVITNFGLEAAEPVEKSSGGYTSAEISLDDYSVLDNNEEASVQESATDDSLNLLKSDITRCSWSKTEILQLIDLYKSHQSLFKNSSVKNEKVWQLISFKTAHTSEQCKNKFKYLKQKYVEKKDNMSSKKTGEKAIKFEYFDYFEDIFSEDHNIKPVAVASSSRGESNIQPVLSSDSETSEEKDEKTKKRSRSQLQKQLDTFQDNIKEREQAKA